MDMEKKEINKLDSISMDFDNDEVIILSKSNNKLVKAKIPPATTTSKGLMLPITYKKTRNNIMYRGLVATPPMRVLRLLSGGAITLFLVVQKNHGATATVILISAWNGEGKAEVAAKYIQKGSFTDSTLYYKYANKELELYSVPTVYASLYSSVIGFGHSVTENHFDCDIKTEEIDISELTKVNIAD